MLVFENGKTQLGRAPQAADMAYFYDGNMCHQSMLIKTEMVKSRPYDESFRIYADWEEWLAFCVQGKKFEKINLIICNFMVGGLSTGDDASEALKAERQSEIKRINERYYKGPWKEAMSRVAPIIQEYNAVKSWLGENETLAFRAAFNEREFLLKKRRKHMIAIRILIYICCLLLIANISLLFIIFK